MQTLVLKKPLKQLPNLERLNLINKYNSYLKLIDSGFYRDHAMAMAEINSVEQLRIAKNYYQEM